tara:strand:- start:1174 stop:1980 length:807 start_codon:yes stop_codon:yes gene_type:complete
MKILILDGYNLIYRAHYSFNRGEFGTVFSFFRSLRPLIERFAPTKAYFVLEGVPRKRISLYQEYKQNRPRDKDESFQSQKAIIVELLLTCLPVQVIRHPDYECDDVIAHLTQVHDEDECVIVSTDTDFIQLLTQENTQLYNPIRKDFIQYPEYDYVMWKALRGDAADNIMGIKGVGDKTASKLVKDPVKLESFFCDDPEKRLIFDRNVNLIRLESNLDNQRFEISTILSNWNELYNRFMEMEFNSIINKRSWKKYQDSFISLEEAKVG